MFRAALCLACLCCLQLFISAVTCPPVHLSLFVGSNGLQDVWVSRALTLGTPDTDTAAFESVRTNQLSCSREARNITYSFSLKRPWAIRHVDYGLPACSHACGVASLAVQGHPEAVPSLLIIPFSSRVSPVLCMGATTFAQQL
jgi:hypothetical protein